MCLQKKMFSPSLMNLPYSQTKFKKILLPKKTKEIATEKENSTVVILTVSKAAEAFNIFLLFVMRLEDVDVIQGRKSR